MVWDREIECDTVVLKACEIGDAEFTWLVRKEPKMLNEGVALEEHYPGFDRSFLRDVSKFIPPIDNTIDEQKEWIRNQRDKEGDYFFIIWDKYSKMRIGTVSVYDITDKEGEFGRLICKGNRGQSDEVMRLIIDFAFKELKLESLKLFVYEDNVRAVRLYHRNGFEISGRDRGPDGRGMIYMVLGRCQRLDVTHVVC